ncbi:hypothetical protein KR038_009153, partial [Drosophila bunnanda]
MTSLVPILLACFVHLALHTALFIQLDPEIFSNTPILGSQLFYLSLLDLLCHCQVVPGHCNFLPSWAWIVLETIAVFLISEMTMAVVWLTMEIYLRDLFTEVTIAFGLTTSYRSQKVILEMTAVGLSMLFAVIVAAFTNQASNVQKIGRK